METIKNIEYVVESQVKSTLRNPYIMAVLKIVLVLYAAQLAPKVSPMITSIFQNTIVKIVAIALIAYIAEVDFQLAIIAAVVFVLSINLLSGRGPLESYEDTNGSFSKDNPVYFDLLDKPTPMEKLDIHESHTDNYPGCDNVKLQDLLDIFDNDKLKLQKTVQYTYQELINKMPSGTAKDNLMKMCKYIGLPYNKEINDENAPFIASLLLQFGFSINKTCTAPN